MWTVPGRRHLGTRWPMGPAGVRRGDEAAAERPVPGDANKDLTIDSVLLSCGGSGSRSSGSRSRSGPPSRRPERPQLHRVLHLQLVLLPGRDHRRLPRPRSHPGSTQAGGCQLLHSAGPEAPLAGPAWTTQPRSEPASLVPSPALVRAAHLRWTFGALRTLS
jgi:hypothetical protein